MAPELFRWAEEQRLPATVIPRLLATGIGLSTWVTAQTPAKRPLIVGIQGAQGSGKSTTAAVLSLALEALHRCSTAVLSLDDFYLTRQERLGISQTIHPLFITRGVPGTHDLDLLQRVMDQLCRADAGTRTPIPIFEKARDDRLPESTWRTHSGRPDIILLEGWCIGTRPEPQERILHPINALEAIDDANAEWRQMVNARLEGPYADLSARLDRLVMLKISDFDSVLSFRALQEKKLAESRGKDQPGVMEDDKLRRFIMHFERLTRWNLISTPQFADLVLNIGTNQEITEIHAGALRTNPN
mgnify:CR=1 FL=1